MKKLVALLIAAVLVTGCGPRAPLPVSSQGYRVSEATNGYDVCYDGIVYVQFSAGNASWGSVKFDKNTKQPVTCGGK